jgi:hypothetical protein
VGIFDHVYTFDEDQAREMIKKKLSNSIQQEVLGTLLSHPAK